MFLWSCNKETEHSGSISTKKTDQVTDREVFEVTSGWLTTFQSDLNLAVNNQSTTQTYSVTQMVSGVEALINIATTPSVDRSLHKMKSVTFQIDLSNPVVALKNLYKHSYQNYRNHFLSFDSTMATPILIDIAVDSVQGNIAFISNKTIIGLSNTCATEHYTQNSNEACTAAFAASEGYRVGAGDEELELMSYYINPECEGSCGGTPLCQAGPTTAYEAVEERINYNYPANNPPTPPAGSVFLGNYINVTELYVDNWFFVLSGCNLNSQEVGTCLQADNSDPNFLWDPLNCIYCNIYDAISAGVSPIYIPYRCRFISMNIGVFHCQCGTPSVCDAIANSLYGKYKVGKPVFKKAVSGTVPVTWTDPLIVSTDFE